MKQTIRFKTFETNSSSYHSCCILSDEEYKAYQNGEMLLSKWGDTDFVSKEEVRKEFDEKHLDDYFKSWLEETCKKVSEDGKDMYTLYDDKLHTIEECKEVYMTEQFEYDYEEYLSDNGYESVDSESNYEQDHTTREINGVKVHVLCEYGYDY